MPAPSKPRASVVMPFFAAAQHLEKSLPALLLQDAPFAWELLLVDNLSTDGGGELARDIVERCGAEHARVIRAKRPGSYAARQTGVEQARGDILVFLDADCVVQPGWLAAMVNALSDRNVLIVGATVRGDPSQTELVARYSARKHLLSQRLTLQHNRGPFLQTASLAVRAGEARAAGGFDIDLFSAGDADFCWRLQALHPGRALIECADAIVFHRHRESLGALYSQFKRYGQGDIAMLRKHGFRPLRTVLGFGADALRIATVIPLTVLSALVGLVRRDDVVVWSPLLRCVRLIARRHGQLSALLTGDRQRT